MDVRMPDIDGIEATRRLVTAGCRTRVLILTTFDLDEYVYRAMKAGASGFLLKDARREQLVAAIRTVAAGDQLLAPSITRRLIEDFCARPDPGAAPPGTVGQLSERELDVAQRIARGMSNAEIAADLYLAETTVKSHVARILTKLGLRDGPEAHVLQPDAPAARRGETCIVPTRQHPHPAARAIGQAAQ